MHLDWKREQRHLKYKPVVIVEALPQLLATICAFPMVIWLHDYSAVLWLVMIQAVSSLLFSHVVATRAYRLSFNRKHLHGILVFGWPLTVNGLLIFIGMQGDRFIIGANYSMADLGIYSVSISLVLAAIMVVSKFSISLLLPVLSSAQEHPDEFRSRYQVGACILAMSGGMIAMPFLVFGGDLVTMIFGDQYDASHAFVAWFGALVAARVFRIAPTIAALAHGDTINSMIANLYRMLGVLAAMLVAWQAMPLAWIIVCGAGGELVAFIAATYRIYKNFSISIRDSLFAPLMITGVLALTAVLNAFVPDMLERTIVFLFATALLPVLMLVMFPFLRSVFNSELLGLRKLITGA
jgi:O-antigen/teichoic acid export membrane protein